MKILTVTIKNLNSLRGKWHIDFTGKEYISGGIFAITGPTGAGKTTIFDAICLALYSQTSRLGKIGGQANEIMTRRTNECSAKVTFESKGQKYICEWEQTRVKGKFQTAKHKISYFDTGKSISNSKKNTAGIVAEITGLDFSRFRQSMLLEQGRFDRFLSADKNSRAAILKLITGTEIYSTISSEVYKRSQNEIKALEAKQNDIDKEKLRLGGMTIEAIQSEIDMTDEAISIAEAGHKSTEEFRSWHRDIDRLNHDIAVVRENLSEHERNAEAFILERGILEAAERASSLDGEYQALKAKREAHRNSEAEVSELSVKISQQEAECSQISAELPGLLGELSRLKGSVTETPGAVSARIEAAVRNYETSKKDAKEAEKSLEHAKNENDKAKTASSRVLSEGKAARARLNNANENYRKIFDQIMSMRARTTSAVLDQERAKLIEGEECPLCGSKIHPKAVHSESGSENPDDLFKKTERLEQELKSAERALQDAQDNFNEAVKNWNDVSSVMSAANEKLNQCLDNHSAKKGKFTECRELLAEEIRRAGISWNDDTRKILESTREWSARIDSLETQIQNFQQKAKTLQALIVSDTEALDTKRRGLEILTAELEGLEGSFTRSLSGKGFSDEAAFSKAHRDSDEIEAMRRKRDELSSQSERLKGALSNFQKELDAKTAMNLTDKPHAEIEALYQKEDAILKELHQKKGQLTQNLITANRLTSRIRELESEYDAQRVVAENWKEFCGLIGSANGDKYNIFAQKITLGLVVNNANDYLRKMNGRYSLLLTPDNDELEISVRDSQQSGEIRPTSNLSGGERFIVSLALALGLSQISGGKAPVDSLFIDEGFGSLDDEALSAALEALGEIRRDGRMIGIISHISGISEHITTKISVIRKSEGTSILEGPGCSGGR